MTDTLDLELRMTALSMVICSGAPSSLEHLDHVVHVNHVVHLAGDADHVASRSDHVSGRADHVASHADRVASHADYFVGYALPLHHRCPYLQSLFRC